MSATAPHAEDTTLPGGLVRGEVIEVTHEGVEIYEVLDSSGVVQGYTLAPEFLAHVQSVAGLPSGTGVESAPAPRSGVNVPLCVAAIGWFVAQTVFPAARVAALVARLGSLIAKYGVQTVARIFTGARGIAGRTAEQEIRDFALAASGVGGLAACGINL